MINKHEIKHNRKYARWARQLIREKPDLAELAMSDVKIAYLSSLQEKTTGSGRKKVMGECIKISPMMQWAAPYDFMIVIYEGNCYGLTDEQRKILLWHELKHIGINEEAKEPEYYIVPHDYEDFKEIIDSHGLEWDKYSD